MNGLLETPGPRPLRKQQPHPTWSLGRMAWESVRAHRGGPEEIAARQAERLADLVAYARERSPFYRHLYRNLPHAVTDPGQLPVVTRRQLMSAFDDWVTDPEVTRADVDEWIADLDNVGQPYLDHYLVWTTSGTVGEPMVLLQDRASLDLIDALRVRSARTNTSWTLLWHMIRGIRPAVIFATGGHYGGVCLAQWQKRRNPMLQKMQVFPIQTPLPTLVAQLQTYQPTMISAYASALVLLAHEQRAGRLSISPVLLFSTAETLHPSDRQLVESAFGCRLIEGYGASECPAIALECRHQRLHVNADWVIVEPVDQEHRPVPPGTPSHTVLITNLVNRVQPIIRYDLGDSVTMLEQPCPCGSPLPAIQVVGRTDEILSFETDKGAAVQMLPLGLAVVVEETAGVHSYQLVQTGPTSLSVRLEVTDANADQVWSNVQRRLQHHLATHGLSEVAVSRAAEPPVREAAGGKLRHVLRVS